MWFYLNYADYVNYVNYFFTATRAMASLPQHRKKGTPPKLCRMTSFQYPNRPKHGLTLQPYVVRWSADVAYTEAI